MKTWTYLGDSLSALVEGLEYLFGIFWLFSASALVPFLVNGAVFHNCILVDTFLDFYFVFFCSFG